MKSFRILTEKITNEMSLLIATTLTLGQTIPQGDVISINSIFHIVWSLISIPMEGELNCISFVISKLLGNAIHDHQRIDFSLLAFNTLMNNCWEKCLEL